MENIVFVPETNSTNELIKKELSVASLPEGYTVFTHFQTNGKGQIGNSWESEKGQNLLFSFVLHPSKLPYDELFYLSQLVSVGIKKTLDLLIDNVTIKWPNDIYWKNKKLGGILIENSIRKDKITSIVGVGINVNQTVFTSNAPNPVSLKQITNRNFDLMQLLYDIIRNILDLYKESDKAEVRSFYSENLYRKSGIHRYKANNNMFKASILSVNPDGKLILLTPNLVQQGFYFKEVEFV